MASGIPPDARPSPAGAARPAYEPGPEGTSSSDHRPPATDHVAGEEPPPFGGRWRTLYAAVLATLAALIVLFYVFTKAFE